MPLTPDELEDGGAEAGAARGVAFEPALLAELLADVIGEPGALPIFQYALTELFDRREGDRLTVEPYRAMGGVRARSAGVPTTCTTISRGAAGGGSSCSCGS